MKQIAMLCTLLFALLTSTNTFAQWEPERRITFSDSGCDKPKITSWGSNIIHVVWIDNRHGFPNYEIYYKRSTDAGTTWLPDLRLTNDPVGSLDPTVSTSGALVHVAWVDNRGNGRDNIFYRRSTDYGQTWQPEQYLTQDTISSWSPYVVNVDSVVHLVWQCNRDIGYNGEIYYKRSSDGGATWSSDVRLTVGQAYDSRPSIITAGNNVHLVWQSFNSSEQPDIYYRRSTDGGNTWPFVRRLTTDTSSSAYPVITCVDTIIHVAWQEFRNRNDEIYYKRSTDNGTSWSIDTRLTNDPYSSLGPSIISSGPNIHVVWKDTRDGNTCEIYYKRSTDSGMTWGPETRLTNNPAYSWNPSITVTGNIVHVVWGDGRDGNNEVYYKRNPTGNIGVEDMVKKSNGKAKRRIKVIPNPFNDFASVLGWEGERIEIYDITGRHVRDLLGERIGEELTPGIYFLVGYKNEKSIIRVVKIK